jgi:nucleotide-binding universal stress UspA family protein
MQSIVHPTDFSNMSSRAFAHALRIALAAKCTLYVLHVAEDIDDHKEVALTQVRRILTQWGLIAESESRSAITIKLGLRIENVRLDKQAPTDGILSFLDQQACDLIVFATHGRDGLEHWLKGSIAESVFSRSTIPSLFIPPTARGFVSEVSGDFKLRRAR